MTIGQRLFIGFVSTALLVGAVGYVAVAQFGKIEESYEGIINDTVQEIIALENIKNASLRMITEIVSYVAFVGNNDKQEFMEGEEGEFSEAVEIMRKWLAAYMEHISRQNTDEQEFSKEIEVQANYIGYLGAEIIKLKKSGVVVELAVNQEKLEKQEADFTELIDRVIDYENNELREERDLVTRTFTRAVHIVFTGTGLALLLALGMGALLTKSIAGPVKRLTDAAARVKQGNLYSRVDVKGTDEVGRLGLMFNTMVEELQNSQKSLKKHADVLAQSNKELEEFAYIASHDLQEPLRKVKTFGDRLVHKYGETLGEQGQDYLKRMQSATNRMQALINGLLTYSRVTSKAQPFVTVDLNETVRDVLADLEVKTEEAGVKIRVDELPSIEADPVQMRQLFQNLISNALKFRKPGTAPAIEIKSALKSSLNELIGREPGRADCQRVITVSDNGIGFEEEYAEQIFTVFQRLHGRQEYEGTGIGLSVCRKIAARHGGTIEAKSTPGQGATFIVTLPIIQPQDKKKGEAA